MSETPNADLTAAVIELLAEQGYEATSAEQLAGVTQLSRSTFFRRFGSKDDVVFADHERLLRQLSEFLGSTTLDTLAAVSAAARMVLDHHLRQPEISRKRQDLIRQHEQLRNRELVLIPRYEWAFTEYLERVAPTSASWVISAFASGLVAVHNDVLRRWLKDERVPAAFELESSISQLARLFAPALNPGAQESPGIVVARFEPGSNPADILQAIRSQLGISDASQ